MTAMTHNDSYTMDDIANELGISKSTVSRALSDSSRISVETKNRVRECARKHGFKPNLVAKALAGQKTLNLAVAMPFEATALQMMFFHECLSGIVSRAAREGYSALVCMTEKKDREILERVIENKKVDAVILTQLKREDENIALLKKSGIPFVVIGSGAGKDIVQVDSRMKESCAEFTKVCVKNLSENSNVLFVCGSLDVEANNNRLSGFLSGMEDSMLSFHYAVCTEASDMADEISLKNWSLILCSDDVVCMQVLEILDKKEIAVGKDVKLASFHDSLLLQSHSPAISALKVDAFALGEKATELSLALIKGNECENINYVDCSFAVRSSTE
ncbi:LacI family DNA-binding transcriptional regulator [Treponema sp.]|uniref:LacI family DNA-binding transcriptional regulator n=2 Tax=Treponema TaxID=157 RepID=UPI0025DADC31|nr:LacI family DNA-binding transcriptional regulator [Treponema sp.]MBR4322033.1 LacI family DNA-binding transcriptional regulator [Treponema sp.]